MSSQEPQAANEAAIENVAETQRESAPPPQPYIEDTELRFFATHVHAATVRAMGVHCSPKDIATRACDLTQAFVDEMIARRWFD